MNCFENGIESVSYDGIVGRISMVGIEGCGIASLIAWTIGMFSCNGTLDDMTCVRACYLSVLMLKSEGSLALLFASLRKCVLGSEEMRASNALAKEGSCCISKKNLQ